MTWSVFMFFNPTLFTIENNQSKLDPDAIITFTSPTHLSQLLLPVIVFIIRDYLDGKPPAFQLSFHEVEVWIHSERNILFVCPSSWELLGRFTFYCNPGSWVCRRFVGLVGLIRFKQNKDDKLSVPPSLIKRFKLACFLMYSNVFFSSMVEENGMT